MNVNPPLFLSSRLMAAITIEGDTGGIINLECTGLDHDGRQGYNWLVETHDHIVIEEGSDLRSGVGDEPDYTSMMATLLNFLGNGAEIYRHQMSDPGYLQDGDPDPFTPALMEWAYMNDDALSIIRELLDPDAGFCHYCGDPLMSNDKGDGVVSITADPQDVCLPSPTGEHSTDEIEEAFPDDDDEPDDPFVTDDPGFPRGTHVTVITQRGIAFWVIKASADQVVVRMVQDDRDETVDRDDVTLLDREAFCGNCGQIGCTQDGEERDA